MSKFVLESCVALKWVLPEPDSDKALALRDQYVKQVHDLLAPDVFPVEVAHALAKAERRNLIQLRRDVHPGKAFEGLTYEQLVAMGDDGHEMPDAP